MIFSSSSRDFWYEASSSALTYYIEVDGNAVYFGKAVSTTGNARINIGRRVSDYLETGMPDFREYDGVVVPHPRQMRVFNLRDANGVLLGSYTVLLESDGSWTGQYGAIESPVNGHADPRQKIFWTTVEEIGQDIPSNTSGGTYEFAIELEDYGCFCSNGGSKNINYSASSEFSISETCPWIEVTKTGGIEGYLTVSVDENTDTNNRECVVTLYDEYGRKCHITIEQLRPTDSQCLTFEIISGGTLGWNSLNEPNVEYSKDGGNTWTNVQGNFSMNVSVGDEVMVRSTAVYEWPDFPAGPQIRKIIRNFYGSSYFNLKGNVLSVVYGSDFVCRDSLDVHLYNLFSGTNVVSASELILPSILRSDVEGHYPSMQFYKMFADCEKLVEPPVLPAKKLSPNCYQQMFEGCTSLVNLPTLHSVDLADYCYRAMFYGCTAVVSAPELPATEMKDWCYWGMFAECTSLVNPPELHSTNLAIGCYDSMFAGCTSMENAPKLPAVELKTNCYWGMFSDCTSLKTAPDLPAPVLAVRCYGNMFYDCTGLTYMKCLAIDKTAEDCTKEWVGWHYSYVERGTFERAPGVEWEYSRDGVRPYWTIVP